VPWISLPELLSLRFCGLAAPMSTAGALPGIHPVLRSKASTFLVALSTVVLPATVVMPSSSTCGWVSSQASAAASSTPVSVSTIILPGGT